MKFIFLILSLIYSQHSIAQSPWYFGSGEAVNLTNGIKYNNTVRIIAGSLNPSSSAVNAAAGSMYLSTNGTTYVKQDAGSSTNWLPLGVSTPGTLTSINGQSGPSVTIASGTAGTDFAISASGNTITLDIPTASGSNRGLLSSANWTTFNNKEPALTATTSVDYYRGDKTFQALDTLAVVENTNQYFTEDRVRSTVLTGLSMASGSTITSADSVLSAFGKLQNQATTNASNVSTNTSNIATNTSDIANRVVGAGSSVDSEVMLFSGTGGKTAKRATGTGFAKLTSGVLSTSSNVVLSSDVSGVLPMANGGTDKSLTSVIGGVVYTDANSMEVLAAGNAGEVLTSNGGAAPTWVNKATATQTLTNKTIVVANNTITTAASGSISATELNAAIAQIAAQIAAVGGSPTGAIMQFAGTSAPTGYLICDGSIVSRSTYSGLFAVIGDDYGEGDGSTTFALPDLRGSFSRGAMNINTVTGSGSASSNNATFTAHGINRTGFRVRLSSGALTGLAVSTDYYAIVIDANTLAFATSHASAIAGTKIVISGANTAVIAQWEDPDAASRLQAGIGGNTSGVGTRQEDANKSHNHYSGSSIWTAYGKLFNFFTGASNNAASSGGAASTHYPYTSSEGSNDARPRNIALNYIIKT